MRERERRNGFNNLLMLVAVCVLFFVLFAYQVGTRTLFGPGEATYGEDDGLVRFIDAADGTRLAVYWGPAPGAKWTALYFHGSEEDIGEVQDVLASYRLQGINVLSLDYRGFGLSEGKATERNAYGDAERLYDYALTELGLAEDRLILHGRAVGGGVAMHLAATRHPGALILESSFLSVFRLYLPMAWIPGDKFDNQRKAGRVKCPTLVIHGMADERVPVEHGRKLADLIDAEPVRTLWLAGAGHDDLRSASGDRYWAAIRGFIGDL